MQWLDSLGEKGKNKLLGVGKVSKDPSKVMINVYLVEGLKFNFLYVS